MKIGIHYGSQGKQKQRYGCKSCKDKNESDGNKVKWTFYEQYEKELEKLHSDNVICPNSECGSNHVVKKGIINGKQRYGCIDCRDKETSDRKKRKWTFYEQYKEEESIEIISNVNKENEEEESVEIISNVNKENEEEESTDIFSDKFDINKKMNNIIRK